MGVLGGWAFLMGEVPLYILEVAMGVVFDPWQVVGPPRFALWYRGTSLIRNRPPLGPYSRPMPRAQKWSYGGGGFL